MIGFDLMRYHLFGVSIVEMMMKVLEVQLDNSSRSFWGMVIIINLQFFFKWIHEGHSQDFFFVLFTLIRRKTQTTNNAFRTISDITTVIVCTME